MANWDELNNQAKGIKSPSLSVGLLDSSSGSSGWNKLNLQAKQFANIQPPQPPTPIQPEPLSPTQNFALNKFPGITQELADIQTDPLRIKGYIESQKGNTPTEKISNALGFNLVKDAESHIYNSIKDAITGGAERIVKPLSNLGVKDIKWSNILKGKSPIELGTREATPAQKTGDILKAASGLLNVGFSPISALFSEGAKVPIAGTPIKLINLAFGMLGEGGSAIFNQALDKAVETKIISQDTADRVREGGSEMSALAAQMVGGGLAYKASLRGQLGEPVPFLTGLKRETHPIITDLAKTPAIKDKVESVPVKKVNELVNKFGEQDAKTIIQVAAEKANIDQASQPIETPKTWEEANNMAKQKKIKQGKVSGVPEIPKELQPLAQERIKINIERGIQVNEVNKDLLSKHTFSLNKDGYPVMREKGENVYLHDMVLGIEKPKGFEVDHINGNKLDNRLENLRVISHKANISKMELSIRNTSGIKGVQFDKNTNKWVARITVDNKNIHLGSFSTVDEAVKARKTAEIKYFEPLYNQAVKGVKVAEQEPISAVPPQKVSGVAKSIEAKAIEQRLTEKGFDELAEYSPAVIKEQSQMMSDIMAKDIERAKRLAIGKEELPQGLKGATVLSAIEDYAMEIKDGALARELANSPIATEISTAGQTLRLSAERTPDSATAKIREVNKLMEKSVEKKTGGKTERVKSGLKERLKKNIKDAKGKIDWVAFADSITC